MKKDFVLYSLLGMLTYLFLVKGILQWLGLPTFDQLVSQVLGTATHFNSVMAVVMGISIIAVAFWGLRKLPKSSA